MKNENDLKHLRSIVKPIELGILNPTVCLFPIYNLSIPTIHEIQIQNTPVYKPRPKWPVNINMVIPVSINYITLRVDLRK